MLEQQCISNILKHRQSKAMLELWRRIHVRAIKYSKAVLRNLWKSGNGIDTRIGAIHIWKQHYGTYIKALMHPFDNEGPFY